MSTSILFVCLGNICRSPLAEGAFRAEAERHGIEAEIGSAGTGSWHAGQAPDARACAIAKERGVDISDQLARQITRRDFNRYDHIVALDAQVLADLQAMRPGDASAALSLFLDHVAGREGQDVADPYYGGDEGFAVTWDDAAAGAKALVELLMRDQRSA